VGAKHAARTAVEALRREDFSRAFLHSYERAFMAELGDELRRGLDIHRAFARLPNPRLDRLLSILARDDLRRAIFRWGDIDYPSRTFYEAVKRAPLLAAFIRWPLKFPAAWLPWRQR
jgi:flavin-dependent dehydrogenase